MLTRKEKLLVRPFVEQKYKEHRHKVENARSVIDVDRPVSQPHVLVKLRKLQREKERTQEIEKENQRLLWKLTQIMNTNRLNNYWTEPPPNFLNRVFAYSNKSTYRIKSAPAKYNIVAAAGAPKQTVVLKGHSSVRCAACNGKAYKKNQIIPEERVPWEPPKRSWNQKIFKENHTKYKLCTICGKL